MPAPVRDRLLETALRLFYRDGFHTVGIDAVLAESGVAKASLYKHFSGKDGLVAGALELRDQRWRAWLAAAVTRAGPTPRERLLGVFDALGAWFSDPGFRGCLFQHALAEFADPEHPARRVAVRHGAHVRELLEPLAAGAGAPDAAGLAQAIHLLMAGAIAEAERDGSDAPAKRARQMATLLVDDATRLV